MRRHDLLRIDPAVWQAMLDVHPALRAVPLIEDWALHAWPVIARRRMATDAGNSVALGLPLPPCHGKKRICFSLKSHDGLVALPPVLLGDAALKAPAEWQPVIAGLQALGEELDSMPRVFGALLWEHVTSLAYVTGTSDLDLLWPVHDAPTAERLLAGLIRLDADSPVRLDGELELAGGGGVSWREWAHTDDTVLVKDIDGVSLRSIRTLFAAAS